MVLTPSTMLPLGSKAPDFSLTDVVTQKAVTLSDVAGPKGTLVMFLCQHCPYVQHIKAELTKLGLDYGGSGIGLVGISANDAKKYPDDSPPELKKFVEANAFKFPFLFDETQSVAKSYAAACTPDFFLFDANQKLVYRGQLDESRPGSGKPVTGNDLRAALNAVIDGKPVTQDQKPSMGCNIKWIPGNEPPYFG